jgi:hypothetical protein
VPSSPSIRARREVRVRPNTSPGAPTERETYEWGDCCSRGAQAAHRCVGAIVWPDTTICSPPALVCLSGGLGPESACVFNPDQSTAFYGRPPPHHVSHKVVQRTRRSLVEGPTSGRTGYEPVCLKPLRHTVANHGRREGVRSEGAHTRLPCGTACMPPLWRSASQAGSRARRRRHLSSVTHLCGRCC